MIFVVFEKYDYLYTLLYLFIEVIFFYLSIFLLSVKWISKDYPYIQKYSIRLFWAIILIKFLIVVSIGNQLFIKYFVFYTVLYLILIFYFKLKKLIRTNFFG